MKSTSQLCARRERAASGGQQPRQRVGRITRSATPQRTPWSEGGEFSAQIVSTQLRTCEDLPIMAPQPDVHMDGRILALQSVRAARSWGINRGNDLFAS